MPMPPPPRSLAAWWRWIATGLLLAGVTAAASPAEAGGTTEPGAKFATFAAAWQARSVKSLVGCMEPKGSVTFRLLEYPLAGKARRMKPEQATETLKAYFKRIGGIVLKDVTPKRSPKNVRLFDYTYKPAGENPRTTRLHVQLKQDMKRLWVLASVSESRKPR